MSCFICSDRHFQVIAEYAAEYMGADAGAIADTLKRENVRSYNYHYSHHGKERFSKVKFSEGNSNNGQFNNADIITLCHCIQYQSNETDDYEKTIAYSVLNMIRVHALRARQPHEKATANLWSI